MIIKYSEGEAPSVISPDKEEEQKLHQKVSEVVETQVQKKASDDDKPFWLKE
jgi:hypothetical protein